MIEGWPGRGIYTAIHTDRYIYAETQGDKSEFYDLETDPYQLTNQVDNPAYQELITDLKQKLAELK